MWILEYYIEFSENKNLKSSKRAKKGEGNNIAKCANMSEWNRNPDSSSFNEIKAPPPSRMDQKALKKIPSHV